jgi:cytochrome c biogenesis protein CcdA
LGSSTALFWLASGVTRIFPLLAENPEMLRVLHSVLIIAIGWFAVSALKLVEDVTRWVKAKMK